MKTIKSSNQLRRLNGCMVMCLGLSFHFLGYECARAASISLLAAKENGLGDSAIPLTIACGSPASGLVLYLYTKSIKRNGAQTTLRISNAACVLILAVIAYYCYDLNGLSGKIAVVAFYVFREIYVSLLSTQMWGFIASKLDKSTSNYFVTFTGIVSIASAVGGCAVEQLVRFGGVRLLLLTSLAATVASSLSCESSYFMLSAPTTVHIQPEEQLNNQDIKNDIKMNEDIKKEDAQQQSSQNANDVVATKQHFQHYHGKHGDHHKRRKNKSGFWQDSWTMIMKHQILQLLFIEAITHQLCSNMLNLMFHNGLGIEIANSAIRATLVGRFFATVNISSCFLQLFILPNVLTQNSLPNVLRVIPFLVLLAVLLGVLRPGLISVMLGFGTIKVLEYSIMTAASEMIYMPMNDDVRYLGKELIKFFGHKLGKSFSSLILSYCIAHINPSLKTQSWWGAAISMIWGIVMYRLADYLVERENTSTSNVVVLPKSNIKVEINPPSDVLHQNRLSEGEGKGVDPLFQSSEVIEMSTEEYQSLRSKPVDPMGISKISSFTSTNTSSETLKSSVSMDSMVSNSSYGYGNYCNESTGDPDEYSNSPHEYDIFEEEGNNPMTISSHDECDPVSGIEPLKITTTASPIVVDEVSRTPSIESYHTCTENHENDPRIKLMRNFDSTIEPNDLLLNQKMESNDLGLRRRKWLENDENDDVFNSDSFGINSTTKLINNSESMVSKRKYGKSTFSDHHQHHHHHGAGKSNTPLIMLRVGSTQMSLNTLKSTSRRDHAG